jgi:hypothetical protein
VGAVKTQSRIIRGELNPEWNQVFAVGRDKIHGGTLELTVWDAVPNPSLSFSFPLEIQKYVQQGIINPDFDSLMKKTGVIYVLHSSMYAHNVVSTLGFAKCP